MRAYHPLENIHLRVGRRGMMGAMGHGRPGELDHLAVSVTPIGYGP